MTEDNQQVSAASESPDDGISTSKVVGHVFEQILEAIHQGHLTPGEHISDTNLASKYGVSRTPVREALQRLREIGVVEASANRFTRVAVVSPRETEEAMVVWVALTSVLLDEVIAVANEKTLADMTNDHESFVSSIAALDMESAATANFLFFSRLSSASSNAVLRRSITSVVHIVRLGSLHLPRYYDVQKLSSSQAMFIDAVRLKDVSLAHEALASIARIEIPQDS